MKKIIPKHIHRNIAKGMVVLCMMYTFVVFPVAAYAQEVGSVSPTLTPAAVESLTATPTSSEVTPIPEPTFEPITQSPTPSTEETVTETPQAEGSLLDKISNIFLKKVSQITRKKTQYGKLERDNFTVNDPIILAATLDDTAKLTIKVTDAAGESQLLDAIHEIVDGEESIIVQPPRDMKPGKYTLTISDDKGEKYTDEFYWGVLTLNTNKATYLPKDTAKISMAVLDETGEMVCDADVLLSIESPDGSIKKLTTKEGSIKVNDICDKKEFTLKPDYEASYVPDAVGNYALTLTAVTKNGTYTIEDAFDVKESVLFDVERTSATRLYPPLTYPMYISVTANQDFEGTITDVVPESFDIKPAEEGLKYTEIKKADEQPLNAEVLGTTTAPGDLIQPFDSYHPIALGFGEQYGFARLVSIITQKNDLKGHDGIDFDMPEGTPVKSTDIGKVIFAGEGDYGKTVIIEHSWGKSYYGHLSEIRVEKNEEVVKGSHIADSGNTGESTGPHLHFGIMPKETEKDNGFKGMVDPQEYIAFENSQAVLGVSTSTAVKNSPTKQILWNVRMKKGETIKLAYTYNTPLISPELYKVGRLVIEEREIEDESTQPTDSESSSFEELRQSPEFQEALTKAQEKVASTETQEQKILSKPGKIIYTEGRFWQLAIDSVVVSSGITEAESQFGGLQRKVVYVNSNWYAFDNNGGVVSYSKSSDGSSWNSPLAVSDGDIDNYNPSVAVSGNIIHVFWIDDDAENVQGRRIDTASADGQGTLCQSANQGTLGSSFMVTVAEFSATAVLAAYSDTSSDTEVDVFDITGLDGSCTVTDVHPGNMPFGTQGAGLTASDRPVVVGLTSTTAMMVYTDGSNLKSAKYNATPDEWTENANLVAAVADSVYSVAATSTDIWILTVSGTTATNFYHYPKASTGLAETSTAVDADIGAAAADTQDSVLDMDCISATDCKIVFTDDLDTTGPDLIFIDCDNADCSSKTTTIIDSDVGDASVGGNPRIFCPSATNCKIVYGDMSVAAPDAVFIDCGDATCSGTSGTCTSGSRTCAIVDTDLGAADTEFYGDVFCPSDVSNDTDCKFIFFNSADETNDAVWFADCSNASCGTRNALTSIHADMNGDTTYADARMSLYCNASADCEVLFHDAVNGDLTLRDCSNAACSAADATTDIDGDVGGTAESVPNAIDCSPGATDCKIIYNDGSQDEVNFVDCSAAGCTSSTITKIDDVAGAIGTGASVGHDVSLYCVSATDCKATFVADVTGSSELVYMIDCDDAACTTGSAVTLNGPRYMSAIDCVSGSDDCKLAYYDVYVGASDVPVRFADCTNENCMVEWESLTAPWSSQTNVTSVSLTYDSSNTDLYAHIIKDSSEQAYRKSTDVSSISWSSETSYAFTAGDLGHISSPEAGAGATAIGVSLRQNANYEFMLSATLISISGTCDQFDRSTDCSDDGSNTISVAVGGTLQGQTDATVDGSWQISNVTAPASGASVVIFINGESTASERANAVTKYDGTGDITGVVLYQRHLTIGSDDAQTVNNVDIDDYDYGDTADADIFFNVDETTDDITLDPATTPLYTDETLYVLASNTYRPGSGGSSNVITHHMEIPTSATFTADANTIDVKGSWTNNGTYTCSSNTVNLRSTGTSDTIKSSSNAFCNLRINNYLMAYHKLDEGTGATANDASGEGLTGTVSGTPAWTTTTPNASYYGADPGASTLAASRSISMGNVSPVDFEYNQPFSTSTWFKTTTNSGMTLVAKSFGAAGDYRGWNVQTGGAGGGLMYIFLQVLSSVSPSNYLEVRFSTGADIDDGNWHHVVTTYNGNADVTGVKIYLDGSSQSLTETVGTLSSGSSLVTAPFTIGSRNNSEQFYTGDIDDVRVYKRELSAGEVTDLYAGNHPDEGTYTLSDALDVNGNLTISTGGLDQSSSNFSVNVLGNYVNTANLTTRAASTITMDGTSGTKTIQSDPSFNNLIMNDGGGSATFSVDKQRFISTGDITITGGAFTPGSTCNGASVCSITFGDDFTNNDTFTASTGTVTVNDAAQTSTFSYGANTTFNNLTVTTAAKPLVFDKDFRTIVSGTLTLTGAACENRITLDSETTGTQFEFNATGTKNVTYVDVQDSNAITSVTATNSKDSGNNTSWSIDDTPGMTALMRHGAWFDTCGESRNFTF